MSFLNNAGVTTLWSRIKAYLTGAHVASSAITGATNVDDALTALDGSIDTLDGNISTLSGDVSNLSGQIEELDAVETLGISDITMTSGAIEGSNIGKKNNNIINLVFHTTGISNAGQGNIIGTLTAGLKPLCAFYTPAYNYSNGEILGGLYINTSGNILFYGNAFTSKQIMCACTYLI